VNVTINRNTVTTASNILHAHSFGGGRAAMTDAQVFAAPMLFLAERLLTPDAWQYRAGASRATGMLCGRNRYRGPRRIRRRPNGAGARSRPLH
jgi:hypothetical protein